jgi:type I restriction enzyme S subunit
MMSTKSKLPSGWSLTQLEDICIPKGLVRGPFGGALKKECFVENGYKVYEQKNAIYRDVDLGVYFVDHKLYNSLKRFALKPRDFIVSCSGTIGRIFQIPDNAKEGIINQALLKITTDRNIVDDSYFFQYFDWDRFQSKIIDNTQGGAMQNLVGMDIFRKTEIPLPPLPEQKAIAQVLSTADAAIQTTEKLIAQKELRKKWLMQQLLTGKKRLKGFDGEWKEIHIRDVAKEVSIRNKSDKQLTVLSCTKYDGLVPSLEYFGRKIFADDVSTYKIVPKNHFAYATNHIEEGSIGYQEILDEALISPMYTVFKTDKTVNDNFFYKLLKSHPLVYQYQNRMEGSIDRRGGLRWDGFSIVKIKLPSYDEQTAIAQVLQAADKEISLLKAKAEKLREHKKGLMQQLLTGKIRLKL